MEKHILRNLHTLIRNSALSYMNEFVWQDIELTNEFKMKYEKHLQKNGYDIEFLGATAVITSSSTKYIYVPNQWFVIASYAVNVYEELYRYKEYFKMVADRLDKRLDSYARHLRDEATVTDRDIFINHAKSIFAESTYDEAEIEEAATRLWRFVSDYSWWSGQKTIDRTDFHVSVILNMLNLVNVSQGFVADIVSAYVNDYELRKLVTSIDAFTVNMESCGDSDSQEYIIPDEKLYGDNIVAEKASEYDTIPKPDRVRIKINGHSMMKEIKYKG